MLYILPVLEKKRSSLKYEIICKSISLFKMWKWNLNFHNKHGKLYLKGFYYIECQLKLRCLTILWKSRWVEGGGVFELGNPEGRGAQAVFEIQVEGGAGVKNCAFCRGMWIFSGITQCTLPFMQKIVIDSYCHKICDDIECQKRCCLHCIWPDWFTYQQSLIAYITMAYQSLCWNVWC